MLSPSRVNLLVTSSPSSSPTKTPSTSRNAPDPCRGLMARAFDGAASLAAACLPLALALAVLLPAGASAQSDDRPYLGLDSPSVQEGDSGTTTMTFTARLTDANGRTQAGARTITAKYEVLSGSATAGKDYAAASGSISFSPGETSKTIGVTVLGDTEVEGDETLTLKWTSWENVLLVSYSSTGTIRNDDEDSPVTTPVEPPDDGGEAPGTPADDRPYLGLDSPSVREGDSGATTMTFTARLTDANGRTQASARKITANYEVLSESGDSATAGKDFTAASGTISFAPGETSKTIDVTVLGDTEVEADETLTLKWVAPWTNVLLAHYSKTGTITNDDIAAPALSIADASAIEGKSIAFTVTLDQAVPGGFKVTPSFTDGTATEGTDYTSNTAALDFAGTAGETVAFTVPTTDDVDIEEDETFTVGLSVSGTSHTVTATSTATGTILDDDETAGAQGEEGATAQWTGIKLSTSVTSRNEKEGAKTVKITATSKKTSGFDRVVTVYVGYQSDTATEGTDYNTVNDLTITIRAGASQSGSTTFTLTPIKDNLAEGNETIKIGGSNSGDESVISTSITLTDADIGLTASRTSVEEAGGGQSVTVTARVGALPGPRDVTVQVGKSGDSATEGTDYNTVNDFKITVPANATSATGTFTLTPTADGTREGDETISVTGSAKFGFNVIAASDITIYDNEIALSANPSSVSEDGTGAQVTVTATGGPNSRSRVVRVAVGSGGDNAAEGSDYQTVDDFNLTIPSGSRSATGTFTLTPINDSQYELNDRVSITGTVPHIAVSGTSVLLDDDDIDIQIGMELNVSSASENGGARTVTVTLADNRDNYNGDPKPTIKVGRTGDGATSGTDYAAVSDFTIHIKSASEFKTTASGTFTLTPTNDSDPEGTEKITVWAEDWYSWKVGEAVISLTDDDGGSITLSSNTSSVSESGSATTVTVTATANATQSAARTVAVSVGNSGSATYGEDYSTGNSFSFDITIPSGQSSGTGTFTLTPISDTLVEGNETVGISGSSTGFSVTGTSVSLTDDDTAPAVNLSVGPTGVREGDSGTTITVSAAFSNTNTYAADKTVTVSVGGSGTATSGTDYAAVSDFDITISAGASSGSGTFTLTPTEDTTVENHETIGVSGTSTGLTVNGATLNITDNDNDKVTLSANKSSVAEDGSAADGYGDGHGHQLAQPGAHRDGVGGRRRRRRHLRHRLHGGGRLRHHHRGRLQDRHPRLHPDAHPGHRGGGRRVASRSRAPAP